MKILVISCIPDPESRSLYQFDFTHDTIRQQREEAAFLVINVLSNYTKDFYSTLVEIDSNGNWQNCEAYINHGFAALSSLRRHFDPDVWIEIVDLAIDLAKNEYCDNALADNIKEYRTLII